MRKPQVVVWVVAGTLAVGVAAAIAETGPAGPSVDPTATTTTAVDPTTTSTSSTLAPDEITTTTTTLDAEGAAAGTHPDNHGAAVSEAAHDHSHDAECGNHGSWVSSVARGKEACTPRRAGQEPSAGTEPETDSGGSRP